MRARMLEPSMVLMNMIRRVAVHLPTSIEMGVQCLQWKSQRALDKKRDNEKIMINIGAGFFPVRHWQIMDYATSDYPFPRFIIDFNFNLLSLSQFPIRPDSVSFYYASHCLEHLPEPCVRHVLSEVYRTLKKGQAIRIVVPDYDILYAALIKKQINIFPRTDADKYLPIKRRGQDVIDRFLNLVCTYHVGTTRKEQIEKMIKNYDAQELANQLVNSIPYGVPHNFSYHLNWFNYERLATLLTTVGYSRVYRSSANNSEYPEFRGKYFDKTCTDISLYMEAIK